MTDLTARLRERAADAGFDAVGVTTAAPFRREETAIRERVEAGWFDGLPWFTTERTATSCHPDRQVEDARSVVSLAMSYAVPPSAPAVGAEPFGRISAYAWSRDYHRTLGDLLKGLRDWLEAEAGGDTKPCVDTSPMVDRAAAVRSGVGFYGKHCNVIHPRLGSWIFLGELVTTAELVPDPPSRRSCGSCTTCIPACPTGAIVDAWQVESRRCISYLTIEHREAIDPALRPLMGTWVYGCDVCQDVCPINQRAAIPDHPAFRPLPGLGAEVALRPLLALDIEAFRELTAGTPIRRTGRPRLLRNVAIALGNAGDRAMVPALAAALAEEPEPLVRGHVAWALGRLGGEVARQVLEARRGAEADGMVSGEIAAALEHA